MKYIAQTLQNKFYTYQPGEFLPIYMDGQLHNRKEFIKYKLVRMVRRAIR